MVGTKQILGVKADSIAILAMALILILVAACGGSDTNEPAAASDAASLVSNEALLESEGIVDDDLAEPDSVDSSATDDRVPPQAVVPQIEPDSGSDEEAILAVMERVVLAVRAENTSEYVEACNPTLPRLSEAQTKFVFESVFAPYGEMTGMNHRDVTVRTFDDDTAITKSVMYLYDEVLLSSSQYSFTKIDGIWYANTYCR